MSGLTKQNADHAYRNLLVNDTALVNRLVSKTLNNLSNSGQIDTNEIVANSVSTLIITSDAYSSPIGNVIVPFNNIISVNNDSLVGSITLTGTTPSLTSTITVNNLYVSSGDLVFLTQNAASVLGIAGHFDILHVNQVINGAFIIKAQLTAGKPNVDMTIGYFVVKNSA